MPRKKEARHHGDADNSDSDVRLAVMSTQLEAASETLQTLVDQMRESLGDADKPDGQASPTPTPTPQAD